jgi:3-oxoacyl-[acyl-carrier protein] reductase
MNPIPHLARGMNGMSVLVTGAADGMGRATATVFAREGAHVAVTDISGSRAETVAREIEAEGGHASAWQLDVSDAHAIEQTVPIIASAFGGIDVVINNAGVAGVVGIDDPEYETVWDRHLSIMLTAHARVIRAALPWLRRSENPRIVNIASTEGLGATAGGSSYSAAKAGVIGLTRSLAVELGRDAITVNCVCPGPIETDMTAGIPDEQKTIFAKRRTALGRYGTPAEVAYITLGLCLPAASYVTGAVIPVDGGLMARNG